MLIKLLTVSSGAEFAGGSVKESPAHAVFKGQKTFTAARSCHPQSLRSRTDGSLLKNGNKQTQFIDGIQHLLPTNRTERFNNSNVLIQFY